MTRAKYIKGMTEGKKALEEYKKNASAAIDANKKIANLNAVLATVHEICCCPANGRRREQGRQ